MNNSDLHRYAVRVLGVIAIAGWFCYFTKAQKPPQVVEKVVTQEVVKYVDRVVTKDVIKTITKPDGTKVVIEEKSKSESHTKQSSSSKESSTVTVRKAENSVAFSRILPEANPLAAEYRLELGQRLFDSPAWVTAAISTNEKFSNRRYEIGIRWEFVP